LNFRGFAGTIASGIVRVGDPIISLPSRRTSRVKEIVTQDGNLEEAFAPMSVTLTLEDEIDTSRGDMIVRPGNVPRLETKFDAMLVWMSEQPLLTGQQYIFKHTTKTLSGSFNTLRYRVNVNTMKSEPAPKLELNQIGRVQVQLNHSIAFDPYQKNKVTGAFIVIDRITNVTVGAGMILDRLTSEDRKDAWDKEQQDAHLATEISSVTPTERAARYGQKPVTLLITGLPGAGKTSTAFGLERRLFDQGHSSMVLDGQNLRSGISRDLEFSMEGRSENLRRAAEIAKFVNSSGLICILAMVSPSEEDRLRAAMVVGENQFIVVHLTASPELCAKRNAAAQQVDPDTEHVVNYEPPSHADLILDTSQQSTPQCVTAIMQLLESRKIIG
jgi:bifunctional enzyme CysN/CysC